MLSDSPRRVAIACRGGGSHTAFNLKERATEPRSVVEIADRRNDLAGNLSLHQELHFIRVEARFRGAGVVALT